MRPHRPTRVGVVLVLVLTLSGLAAGHASPAAFSRDVLFGGGPVRTFEGRALGEVAFPLGGIGSVTTSLGGRGNLRDWEIFNRPNKGGLLPFTFAALGIVG